MILRTRQFTFTFPCPVLIMGVVNVTPDSFSDGGKFATTDAAVEYLVGMKYAKNGIEDSPFVYTQLAGVYVRMGRFIEAANTLTLAIINASGGGIDVVIFGGGIKAFRTLYSEYDLLPDEILAEAVRRSGAKFFRGGAFKPRTSPYAFQGLGEDGLKILEEIRETYGLKIVTEALDDAGVDLVERYADIIQIGARSMQNFTLLRRVGKSRLPVLLKRGLSATLDEWLLAAEYIMSEGNYQIVLCERGIRTFAQHTRNTLDLSAVPAVRRISHLPVIVDPSHGTGKNYMVTPLARAGVAVGADGLIIEVHDQPDHALCDGAQALTLAQYEQLVSEVRAIHEVIAPAPVT